MSPVKKIDIPCLQIKLEVVAMDLCGLSQSPHEFSSLSDDELSRIAHFKFKEDGNRFGIVRSQLRILLSERLGVAPNAIQLGYGPYGKPHLKDTHSHSDTLQFNVSHSEDLALFAFSENRAIGIDVEKIRPIYEVDLLVEKVFSQAERISYRGLSPNQRERGFFNCWTRKEAFVKASGLGLEYPLQSFDVSLHPDERARILQIHREIDLSRRWEIAGFEPQAQYVASVVTVDNN